MTNGCSPLYPGKSNADFNLHADLGGALAGYGERNFLGTPQPDIPALAILLHPADPRLATAKAYDKVKAITVTIASWFLCGLNGSGRKLAQFYPTLITTLGVG